MKLLTIADVKAEAAKGEGPALDCSRLHWEQGLELAMSPRGEKLREALKRRTWLPTPEFCALCQRHTHSSCGGCFLSENRCTEDYSPYDRANKAIDNWEGRRKGGSILKVRQTMKDMIKALQV